MTTEEIDAYRPRVVIDLRIMVNKGETISVLQGERFRDYDELDPKKKKKPDDDLKRA